MDQFVADSGTFTLNGPNFYKRGFSHMYNYGDGGGSLWVDNLEKNVHSVEFSVSGLDVGDYDYTCYMRHFPTSGVISPWLWLYFKVQSS